MTRARRRLYAALLCAGGAAAGVLVAEGLLRAAGTLYAAAREHAAAGGELGAFPEWAVVGGPPTGLCAGDSYTFGVGARASESYPAVLQRLRPGSRVVNVGRPGENSAQVRHRLEKALSEWLPSVVILMAGANNEHNPEGLRYDRVGGPPAPGGLARLSSWRTVKIARRLWASREAARLRRRARSWRDDGEAARLRERAKKLTAELRFRELGDALSEAARRLPYDAELQLLVGNALFNEDRHPEAIPFLERAAALDPARSEAPRLLVGSYYSLGRIEDMRDAAARAHRLHPGDADMGVLRWVRIPHMDRLTLARGVLEHDLRAMAALCRRWNARLVVVTYPYPHWANPVLVAAAEEEGAGVIRADDILQRPDKARLVAPDGHPNAAGYRLLAERVEAGLRRLGLP